jgi:Putative transposase
VRVLSRLFRRLFIESLGKAFDAGKLQFFGTLESLQDRSAFIRHLAPLKDIEWVVYAKAPFAGPEQVLDYVGRYTHRVAISNNRLLDIDNDQIRFRWKDYRHGDQVKTMTLTSEEFIRRFLLHVLPNGFRRIRYYGFLGNRHREEKLALCRRLLGMQVAESATAESPPETDYLDRYEELTGRSLRQCPQCGRGSMVVVQILPRFCARSPVAIDSS